MQDAQMTIRLPKDLKAKLQARAVLEDRSLADVSVRLLSQGASRWATATAKKEQA